MAMARPVSCSAVFSQNLTTTNFSKNFFCSFQIEIRYFIMCPKIKVLTYLVMLIWIPNNYTQKKFLPTFYRLFFSKPKYLTTTFQLLRHIMTSYKYLFSSEYCKLKQGD